LRRRRWLSPVGTALAVVIGIILMSLANANPGSLLPPAEHVFRFGSSAPVHHQGQGNALTPENLNPTRATSKPASPTTIPSRTPTTELLVAAHPVTAAPAASATVAPAAVNAAPLEIVGALIRVLDQLSLTQSRPPASSAHAAIRAKHRAHRPHKPSPKHHPHVKREKDKKQTVDATENTGNGNGNDKGKGNGNGNGNGNGSAASDSQ
jgi:hypothetical protein